MPGTFDLGFTAGLMSKDVKLFLAEREALGVTTNVIDAVAGSSKRTCDELGPEVDVTAVIGRSRTAPVSKCARSEESVAVAVLSLPAESARR